MPMFALIKPNELAGKPMLGLKCYGDDFGSLVLSLAVEDEGSPGVVTVVPGSFDKQTTRVNVPGFGNGSTMFTVNGGLFRRNQSEIAHELAQSGPSPLAGSRALPPVSGSWETAGGVGAQRLAFDAGSRDTQGVQPQRRWLSAAVG